MIKNSVFWRFLFEQPQQWPCVRPLRGSVAKRYPSVFSRSLSMPRMLPCDAQPGGVISAMEPGASGLSFSRSSLPSVAGGHDRGTFVSQACSTHSCRWFTSIFYEVALCLSVSERHLRNVRLYGRVVIWFETKSPLVTLRLNITAPPPRRPLQGEMIAL